MPDLENIPINTSFLRTKRTTIHFYDNKKKGKTLVLIHGWNRDLYDFRPIIQRLNESYRIIAFDLPGFGQSSFPPSDWDSIEFTREVEDFLYHFKLTDKIHLIGHSFGGKISLLLAFRKKIDIDKLILIGSPGIRNSRSASYYIKVYYFKFLKMIYKALFHKDSNAMKKLYEKFGSQDYRDAGNLRNILVKVVNENLKSILKNIDNPCLLIWGEYDSEVSYNQMKGMEKRLIDAGLIVFENCTHFAHLENMQRFFIILKEFLN